MCFTHCIWISGFTKHLKELSILQYRMICVLWDTDSFATVKRRGRLLAQTSTQCGNTGLQTFAANLYIIIFWMQLYIDITVTCTCVSILARVFEVRHGPYYVFFFYIWIIKGVNRLKNIGIFFFFFCQKKSLTLRLKHMKSNLFFFLHLLPNYCKYVIPIGIVILL